MQLSIALLQYSLLIATTATLTKALPTTPAPFHLGNITTTHDIENPPAAPHASSQRRSRQVVLDIYDDYLCNSVKPVNRVTYSGANFGDAEMKGCLPMPYAEQGKFIRVVDSSGCRASTKNVMARCEATGDAEVEIAGCRRYSYVELHIDCSG